MEKKKAYTEKQLIKFGRYILSKKRESRIDTVGDKENLREVYHSDLHNWKNKK